MRWHPFALVVLVGGQGCGGERRATQRQDAGDARSVGDGAVEASPRDAQTTVDSRSEDAALPPVYVYSMCPEGGPTSGEGGALEDRSGPTPPAGCVAPCVWEMARHCIPEWRSCVRTYETDPLGTPRTAVLRDATTGWTVAWWGPFLGRSGIQVSHDGITCYGATFSAAGGTSGGDPVLVGWGDCQNAASGFGDRADLEVACGMGSGELLPLLSAIANGATDASLPFTEKMSIGTAACADWTWTGLPASAFECPPEAGVTPGDAAVAD